MRRVALALLLLAACGGESGAGSDYDWEWTDPSDRPTATVIDPGSEPLAVLEYRWAEGDSILATMTMDLDMVITAAGETIQVDTRMTMRMEGRVLALVPEGYVLSSTILEVEVESSDEETAQATEDAIRSLVGKPIITLSSPRGETLAIDTSSIDSNELFTQFMGDFGVATLPFPEDAVGLGAVWRSEARFDAGGMTVVQTTTHRIVAWEGNNITVELDLGQESDATTGAMAGVTIESSGSGGQVIDLSRLMPVTAHSAASTRIEMPFATDAGSVEAMIQQMDMSMEITTEP